MVTGQVIFREAGEAPTKDGRKLLMVVGLIAVPMDFDLKGEHQYTVSGTPEGVLTCHAESGQDVSQQIQGQSLGGLLKSPMWRC